jgi:RNA polymerase sigma-70 factor (ECF subfamily)
MGSLLTASEEAELVAELRAGSDKGFEGLVRAFGPAMRAVTRRMLKNDEDADDALQEAFVAAFRAIPRFEARSSLGTWLHRIAVNAALMRMRSRQARVREDASEEVEELLPRFVGLGVFQDPQRPWGELPEDPLARSELCGAVRAAIESLPEPYRVALMLRDIEELSNEELAKALGVSVNAAKIRVHRARQALRTLLEPRIQEFDS